MRNRALAAAVLVMTLPAGARAAFPACDAALSTQTVTLVHVTDLHAHFNPGPDGVSPYARARGYFDSVRAASPYALFLDGGDDEEKGSIAGPLSKGAATRDMTRMMRFDVRVMGNHDFAYGEEAALDHARDPHAIVLASNLRYVGKDPLGFAATDYAEIAMGCVTIGFVGPVTEPWDADDEPFAGPYPGFRGRYDYAAAVRRVLRKRRKADAIVVLSHLGREDDLKLARAVPAVDLVLGGHTHGVTWEPIVVGRARYAESGHDAEFLTRVDLDFDARTRRLVGFHHRLMHVDADMPVDPAVQAAAVSTRARWEPAISTAPACACRDADKRAAAETAARAALSELKADAVLVDEETVWVPWKAGPLTPQAFLDAFKVERQPPGAPGFSSFQTAKVDGGVLRAMSRRADRARWVYRGPAAPRPGRTYRVALPRRAALYPREQLKLTAPLPRGAPAGEVFEVLSAYAARRRGEGLCVDDGCTPDSSAPPRRP